MIAISLAYQDSESPHERKYQVNDNYIEAIKRCGGIPMLIPILNQEDTEEMLAGCSGLLLTGGGGLLPHVQKMKRLPSLYDQNPKRHQHDTMLAKLALQRRMPILGICRGLQVINEIMKGTLQENIDEVTQEIHLQKTEAHMPCHSITISHESLLFECFKQEKISVNSFHSQAVKQAGAGLQVIAKSPDGIIEAVQGSDDPFILGLQFHPEDLMISLPYFEKPYRLFIEAAANYYATKL